MVRLSLKIRVTLEAGVILSGANDHGMATIAFCIGVAKPREVLLRHTDFFDRPG